LIWDFIDDNRAPEDSETYIVVLIPRPKQQNILKVLGISVLGGVVLGGAVGYYALGGCGGGSNNQFEPRRSIA